MNPFASTPFIADPLIATPWTVDGAAPTPPIEGNLVVNGAFDTDLSNWNYSFGWGPPDTKWDNGQMLMRSGMTSWDQEIVVPEAGTYRVTWDAPLVDLPDPSVHISIHNARAGTVAFLDGTGLGLTFDVALSAQSYWILLRTKAIDTGAIAGFCRWDNISVVKLP